MKHYKDENDNLFGYEDDIAPPEGLVEITMEEVREINISKQVPPSAEQIARMRQSAYSVESDPIFFKVQRGEATQQEWLDKVAEIKERFPMPTAG